jgi:hypothetical protein
MYPDFTTQPPRFMFFGNTATATTPAFVGAATAATGNVGNGTVTNITAFSGFTKTELLTLKCVTPGSAGAFYVSGSLSGALGLAAIGTTFTASVVSFLINTGGVAFAANDSFTIAATASNYV